MNEVAKNSKNTYEVGYKIQVPVLDGLKLLFQQLEELRSEFGVEPSDEYFTVLRPTCDKKDKGSCSSLKALVNYSRTDALLVLNGKMNEDEYIMRHICSVWADDGLILTEEDGGLVNFAVTDIF